MNEKIKNEIIQELKNDKILRGLLGMSSSEIEIYFLLIGRCMSAGDLAKMLGIEKSSVYKCMKNLYERKLVKKRRINTKESRYVFNSVSPSHFTQLVERKLRYWYGVIECLGGLEEKKLRKKNKL